MSNQGLWGLTLLERNLKELHLLGIREVVVFAKAGFNHEEKFDYSLPEDLNVVFPEIQDEDLFDTLRVELAENEELVLVLEGHALHDRRILRELIHSETVQAVISPFGINPAGAGILSASHAFLFADRTARNLTEILREAIDTSKIPGLDLSHFEKHLVNLRRKIDPYLILIENAGQLNEADRILRQTVHKGVNDFVAKHIHPALEFAGVRLLVHTSITPNQITILWIMLAALVIPLFASGHLLVGLVLAAACGILDGIDGKLARLTLRFSRIGDRLDHVSNTIYDGLWYLALGRYFSNGEVNSTAGILTLILFSAYVIERIVPGIFKKIHKVEIYDYSEMDKLIRLVGSRMNNNLWFLLVGTTLGFPRESFFVVSVWMVGTATYHTVRLLWVTWKYKIKNPAFAS